MQNSAKIKNSSFSIKTFFVNLIKNKACLACLLLSLLYFFSGYCKWIEIAVCAVAIVFMFVFSTQQSLCIFLFMHSFTLSNNGYDSWFVATMVGFCVSLLIKYIIGLKHKTYKFHTKIAILIAVLLTFSSIISIGKPLFYNAWIYYTYLPIAYFIFAMRKNFNLHESINYLFGGLVASFCLGVVTIYLPYYKYSVFFGNRFRALINHPNYLYMRALFVLSYYMFHYLKEHLSRIKFVFIYLICAGITLSTLSKTGAVMLIIITGMFILLYLKEDFKRKIKVVGIFTLCALVLFTCCYKLVFNILDRFLADFNSNDIITSVLTGRDEIWLCYLKEIFSSPLTILFGKGLLAERTYITTQYCFKETHNLYLFLLYRFGIVGCALLTYIVYLFIKELCTRKPKLIAYLPLIFVLTESLFDNTFKCYNIMYIVLSVMILFTYTNKNENKILNE